MSGTELGFGQWGKGVWGDFSQRGNVPTTQELTDAPLWRKPNPGPSAPALARRHEAQMRQLVASQDRGS